MNKKIFLLLFIMILFFIPNVYAASYNVTNKIKSTPSDSGGTFSAVDISSGIAIPGVYNVNTRYNGVLNEINFYVYNNDWDWQYNKTYTVTLTMATEDWRNHFMGPVIQDCNLNGTCWSSSITKYVSGSFRFISQKKISFNIKTGSNIGAYLKFTIYSGSGTTGMTGVTNFNLNGVTIATTTTVTPTPVPSTPTPTPAPTPTPQPNNQDIINNQTQNTQDIINNNNTNTNSIINNQTQNTQDIIDSNSQNTSDIIENNNSNTEQIIENNNANMTCPVGPLEFTRDEWADIKGKYLKSDGSEGASASYGISPYFIIKPNIKYKMVLNNTTNNAYYCLYSANKSLISCSPLSSYNISFTTPNNAQYLRITLGGGRVLSLNGPVCNDWEKEAMEKLKDVNQSIYNSITDDTTPTIDVDLDTASDTPIIDLIYMPLNLIGAILDETENTCSPYVMPFDFSGGNNTITFPCIDLRTLLGNDFYNILNAIICFYMVYNIGLMCVTIYNDITTLSDSFRHLYYSNDPDVIGFGRSDE